MTKPTALVGIRFRGTDYITPWPAGRDHAKEVVAANPGAELVELELERTPRTAGVASPSAVGEELDRLFPEGWRIDIIDRLLDVAAVAARLGLVAERGVLIVHAGPYVIDGRRTPYAARVYHGRSDAYVDSGAAELAVAELEAAVSNLGDDLLEHLADWPSRSAAGDASPTSNLRKSYDSDTWEVAR